MTKQSKQDSDDSIVIQAKGIKKTFDMGVSKVKALQGVDLTVGSKDFIIIFGPSGCGKSTLLNVLLGLEPPDAGKVFLRKTDIYALNEDDRAAFRARKLGVVYQQPTWIKSLSVIDNVAFPILLKGMGIHSARKLAMKRLEEVGMEKYENHRPVELSGGQQQKVGFARALVNNPWTIFLDEPTGNLDSKSGDDLLRTLVKINKEGKRTVIMVTHNVAYLLRATRVIHMVDGKNVGEYTGIGIQKFIREQVLGLKQ